MTRAEWTYPVLRHQLRRLAGGASGIFTAALFAPVALMMGVAEYSRDLPDYRTLAEYKPPVASRVYSSEGRLIGEFASEKRIFVPYGAIPKRLVEAFVAAEDQHFFEHPGFDLGGMLRAARSNIATGKTEQGGSTITQQVAKNMLLTPERSMRRKVRELLLAVRIERALGKEKILELYLNEIYLGNRAYGVAAAAQVYFDKGLDELSLAESALLAGLPRAPTAFNPARRGQAALDRRNYVLDRMAEDGRITAAERDAAKAEPLKLAPPKSAPANPPDYFVEEVRRELVARYGSDGTNAAGFTVRSTVDLRMQATADDVLRRGLVAYDRRQGWRGPVANLETLHGEEWRDGWRKKFRAVKPPAGHGDWPLALVINVEPGGADIAFGDGRTGRIPLAELTWARKQGDVRVEPGKPKFRTAVGPAIGKAGDVLKAGDVILVENIDKGRTRRPGDAPLYTLRQVPEVTGALVAMEPGTGRVRAIAGGFSFQLSQFNNATQAWRQPGSSFKPYVYLAALEANFTPATIALDMPMRYTVAGKSYEPQNYSGDFLGPMTMRSALEQSRNVIAIRFAEATGLKQVADLAARLGVSDRLSPVMSLALGSFETTPMRQATAYAMIANGGRRVTPTLIDRIQDRDGRTVERHAMRDCARCNQLAYDGQSMPILRAAAQEQVLDPVNAYQMTSMLEGVVTRGTGVALRELGRPIAGKTGTTNDFLDAWFVGYTPDLVVAVWIGFDHPRSLGRDSTGGALAAPIARDFFKAALAGRPKRDFVRPKDVVVAAGTEGQEFFKRGTEPGTGGARQLDDGYALAPPPMMEQIGRGAYITY